MTEYWVSKKQYWCKYCSIFIRDDAPSRRQHETGLKHQGNKERYIRDLYRSGSKARIDKEREAVEIARIEATASASGDSAAKQSVLESLRANASSSQPRAKSKPKDRFSDYTSAQDLGLHEESTSYEVEQELKGRAGEAGAWETVEAGPSRQHQSFQDEREKEDDEEHENFMLSKKRDRYEEDEWDPKSAIKAKIKLKMGQNAEMTTGWTGRIELQEQDGAGLLYIPGGGWVRPEPDGKEAEAEETKPSVRTKSEEVKAETSLFKKRRPPPSSRKT